MEGVDDVVHLAAKVSFAGDWDEFVLTNVTGTRVVLETARRAGVDNVVFVSSPSVAHTGDSIVGEPARAADPCTPAATTPGPRPRPSCSRSRPTAAGCASRPCARTSCGAPGTPSSSSGSSTAPRRGGCRCWTTAPALIDTTYVDNAAEAVVRALERIEWAHGRALVVTNGQPRTVGELVAGFCRAAGVEPPTRRVPGALARLAGTVIEKVWAVRPGADEPPMTAFLAEQMSTAHWFEQQSTREVLDWTPSVTVEEGMARLAEYYRTHPLGAHDAPMPATGSTAAR